ncbi:hypothetical protein ILUMI_01746 [Ignelater luminosus]|uniref:Uncharacterized protein n=1 Tax=Ignelater luminosus TaxID=2038154 RepID=A0A8K0DJF4_IGNLU|nr:hypothetical protein ILUMI_01746 [Ignelater luminosus]
MACPVHRKPPSCGLCAARNAGIISGLRGFPRTDCDDYKITISVNVGDEFKSQSFMYEHDATYDEPYMDELANFRDASTGVQTDLMLGEKLESESLNSIELEQEGPLPRCDSRTEMPWQKISLAAPGTYSIKPTESKRSPEVTSKISTASKASKTSYPPEEQESNVGPEEEEEEQGAVSLSSATDDQRSGDPESTRKRKQPLLFESERYKHNEPYMEGLYRAFPNSDEDDNCGSDTEMPWKDILLPKNCKIKKVMKGKRCTCKSAREKLSGMFMSPSKSSRKVEEDEDEGVIQIHIGFEEPPSGVISVQHGACSQQTVSLFSDITQQAKRVPKQYKLQIDLAKNSNVSVSFQGEKASVRTIPTGSTVGCKSSRTISCSSKIPGKNSSNIVNIKPFVECPFPSERIFIPTGKPSAEIKVTEPLMYIGNVPSQTRSCSTMQSSKMSGQPSIKSIMKSTSSMPGIPSKGSVKATVSLKQMGQPDKVVSQSMGSTKGENLMTFKVPDEPISIELKMSNLSTPAAKCISSTETSARRSVPRCPCISKGKTGTSRPDPVMAAIEAYEAEMKPLMKAVTELQEKIRNLNLTEMNDYGCTSGQQPGSKYSSSIAHSKVHITGEPGKVTRTTTRVRPPIPGQYPQMTCPFVQPISFGSSPSPIYGKMAVPILSSTYQQPYIPSTSKYVPSTMPDRQTSCGCQRSAKSVKESRLNKDFSSQAKTYGMSSDYQGRKYQEEKRRGCCNAERYKTQKGITGRSSGNVTSDYSDVEDKCPLSASRHKSSKDRHKHRHHDSKHKTSSKTDRSNKNDGCPPCKDYFEKYLRPGQAVKTSPEEFLSCTSCKRKTPCGGVHESPSSKSKFEFRFPYR